MDTSDQQKPWFYESAGERKGGFSEQDIIAKIDAGEIRHGTAVWKQGLGNWTRIEQTELAAHLERNGPPPLTGEHVNNTIVWVLAFAPLIGLFLESFVAAIAYGGNEYRWERAMANSEFWYITLILNVALSYGDEKKLEKSGIDTDKFKGMVWLVPVYLYQRAKALGQNMAYFAVWIVCFLVMLAA